MYDPTKTAILFTGLICKEYFEDFIDCSRTIKELKIASIWENTEEEYIQKLIQHHFIIIINSVLEQNVFKAQSVPIVNGIQFIKNNYKNIECVLRTRLDVLSCDYSQYLEKTESLYKEKITVIAGIQTDKTYFFDLIVCGTLTEMVRFFNHKQYCYDHTYTEKFLMENYTKTANPSKEDIAAIFHFSLPICIQNNIEFIWIRSEAWRNSIRTIPCMRVINEYCRDDFIWI